jgi:hypothetical protein
MGRYYFGSIVGKFWFGIQDDSDVITLGGKPEHIYEFCGCNCIITEDEMDNFNDKQFAYCQHCYPSFKAHLSDVEIDDEASFDVNNNKSPVELWSIHPNMEYYRFTQKDLEWLNANLYELENSVGEFMDSYKIIDNNEIEYDYELPDEIDSREVAETIARLCLGRQIKYCIEKNKYCSFTLD